MGLTPEMLEWFGAAAAEAADNLTADVDAIEDMTGGDPDGFLDLGSVGPLTPDTEALREAVGHLLTVGLVAERDPLLVVLESAVLIVAEREVVLAATG